MSETTVAAVLVVVSAAGWTLRRLLAAAGAAGARRRVGDWGHALTGDDGGVVLADAPRGTAPRRLGEARPGVVGASIWTPPARFMHALAAADVGGDPARWWWRWLAMVAATVTTSALAVGGVAAVSTTLVTTAGPAACLYGARHRHDERIEGALPEVLETAAAALRSGASLPGALTAASRLPGPLGPDLRSLVAAVDRGAPLVSELDRWAARRPLPGVRLSAAALAMGAAAGGARARAVDGIADTLRDRAALGREVAAQSAQARSSVAVMSIVPLVVSMLAAATDPRTATFLFRTAAGAACLWSGLLLDGIAVLWMLRLIRRVAHVPSPVR